jgi:hypothetical protein
MGLSSPLRQSLSLRPLPSGPSPRLRPGGANLQTRSVLAVPPGFNGFLRRGPTEVGPSTACGFVAPRSRPWGSPGFKSAVASRPLDPKVFGLSPLANDPSKRSSSPAAFDQRVTAEDHPFGQPRVHRVAFLLVVGATPRSCCHARTLPRPQGLVPPESSRRAPNIAAVHPPDASMGFMGDTFRCLPRSLALEDGPRGPRSPFAWRYQPRFRRPDVPERAWEGDCLLGLVWLRGGRGWGSSEEASRRTRPRTTRRLRRSGPPDAPKSAGLGPGVSRGPRRVPAPAAHLGSGGARPRKVEPKDRGAPAKLPEGFPLCRSVSPEGARSPTWSRRNSEEPHRARCSCVPEDACTWGRALPRRALSRRRARCDRLDADRFRTRRYVPVGSPPDRASGTLGRTRAPPEGDTRTSRAPPEGGGILLMAPAHSSKLGGRPQARLTSSPGKASQDRSPPPTGEGRQPSFTRRGCGGDPHNPPSDFRPGRLRSEGRSPPLEARPKSRPVHLEPKLAVRFHPSPPKRALGPQPVSPRLGLESNVSMFTSKIVS